MNTEILCVKKIGENKYFNSVFNFTGTLNECEDFARQKNFGGGVEILNKKKDIYISEKPDPIVYYKEKSWFDEHVVVMGSNKKVNETIKQKIKDGFKKSISSEQEKIIHDEPAEHEEVL